MLSPDCPKRISIEAGATLGWEKFVGINGLKFGIDNFGMSAPSHHIAEKLAFTSSALFDKTVQHFKSEHF